MLKPSIDLPHCSDKSQSTYGTACSIPDIGTSNLTVSNVATISMTAAPATGQKQAFPQQSHGRIDPTICEEINIHDWERRPVQVRASMAFA